MSRPISVAEESQETALLKQICLRRWFAYKRNCPQSSVVAHFRPSSREEWSPLRLYSISAVLDDRLSPSRWSSHSQGELRTSTRMEHMPQHVMVIRVKSAPPVQTPAERALLRDVQTRSARPVRSTDGSSNRPSLCRSPAWSSGAVHVVQPVCHPIGETVYF